MGEGGWREASYPSLGVRSLVAPRPLVQQRRELAAGDPGCLGSIGGLGDGLARAGVEGGDGLFGGEVVAFGVLEDGVDPVDEGEGLSVYFDGDGRGGRFGGCQGGGEDGGGEGHEGQDCGGGLHCEGRGVVFVWDGLG